MQPDDFAHLVVMTVQNAVAPFAERLAKFETLAERAVAIEKTQTELRDRLVTIETKAGMPPAPDPAIGELRERVTTSEMKTAQYEQRLVALETREIPEIPKVGLHDDSVQALTKSVIELQVQQKMSDAHRAGLESRLIDATKEIATLRERNAVLETRAPMPGPPGPAGKDGTDGKDGKHGEPGLAGLSFEGVYQEGKSYDVGQLTTWAGSSWHCNKATTSKPGEGSSDWTLMVKRGRDGKDGRDAVTMPVVSLGGPK